MDLSDQELSDLHEAVQYAIGKKSAQLALHHTFYSRVEIQREYKLIGRWRDLIRKPKDPTP